MLSAGEASRSTMPCRIARADGDLRHVDVGRVEQAARLGDGDDGERVGQVLGADRRALERIEGDVDLRAVAGADLLADEEHRRLVALALADDDRCHRSASWFSSRRMASTAAWSAARLVAAAAKAGGGDRRALGDARPARGSGCGRAPERSSEASHLCQIAPPRSDQRNCFDPDHLRLADNMTVAP